MAQEGDSFWDHPFGSIADFLIPGDQSEMFGLNPPPNQNPANLPVMQDSGHSGGYPGVSGTGPGVRGDEQGNTEALLSAILRGANDAWVRAEAKQMKYSLADFNAVTRISSVTAGIASRLGLPVNDGRFAMLLNLLEEALRGARRRGKRQPGLKTVFRVLQYSGGLLRALQSAGRGLARATMPAQHKGRR